MNLRRFVIVVDLVLTAHDPRTADVGHPASSGVALLHPWALSHIVMDFQKYFWTRENPRPSVLPAPEPQSDRFRPGLRSCRDSFRRILIRKSLLLKCYVI